MMPYRLPGERPLYDDSKAKKKKRGPVMPWKKIASVALVLQCPRNEWLAGRGVVERLSKKQRTATPVPFRDLLLSLARSAGPR